MSKNPLFTEAILRPRTDLFLRMIQEKVRYREHIGIEIKGGTRTGKSSVGIAVCKFISALTGVPFTLQHICPNEIIYLQRLKDPKLPNGSVFLIDEQTETHTGAGSYSEMSVLEDIQQICAKEQIHSVWCMEENTLIKLPTGYSSIKDLPKKSFELISFNFEKEKIEVDTAIKTFTGEKVVYKVTTESGKIFEATEDHRFFVENQGKIEEKRLKNLKIGDKLVVI
jgi:hypothetical protein